ncbi:MAG: glycosyltransferase family 4 protein [Anaerolineaceae bacterium]|nr:glycosyltransferase family 4 protein [Anaerolineaceae bacterium]MCB9102240.1 glycosyltransferase family 4 protein [Anaerolineales bacterium]
MKLLMVSQSEDLFSTKPASSNTLTRLHRYLTTMKQIDSGSRLDVLVFTRKSQAIQQPFPNLRLIPIPAPKIQLLPLYGMRVVRRLASLLSRPDVITVQTPVETGLLGLWLKRYFKAPLEVQIHFNLFSPYWLAERQFINSVRLKLARYIIKQAEGVRSVSNTVAHRLQRDWAIPRERIEVIPVPVFYQHQPTWSAGAVKLPTVTVLFVGRLVYPKNIPGLFRVINTVLARMPESHFVIVGDGVERSGVEAQAKPLNAEKKRVFVLGTVPYNELPLLYRQTQVLVQPSLYEGFGRTVLEGYLFETPAVATRCGGPEDIIKSGETGYLTDIEAMDEFAERVIWLLEHPTEAKEMGACGRNYVQQQFDPNVLVGRMVGRWQHLAEVGRQ